MATLQGRMEPSSLTGNPKIYQPRTNAPQGPRDPGTYPDKQPGSFEPRDLDPARDSHLTVESDPIRSVVLIAPPQGPDDISPKVTCIVERGQSERVNHAVRGAWRITHQ